MAELTEIITADEPDELGIELAFPIGPLCLRSDTAAR